MTVEYPKDVKSLQAMLHAANREVTRLSDTVSMQAAQINAMGSSLNKWEQRFDRLLEIRR
jgi:DNA repair ATPase RecN